MRVSLQRSLILPLCFLSSVVVAEPRTADWRSSSGWNCSAVSADQNCIDGSAVASIDGESQTYYWRASCLAPKHPVIAGSKQIYEGVPNYSLEIPTFECMECEDPVTHQPGGPPVDDSCPQSCAPGYVHTQAPYNPDAGTEFSTGYDCMVESTNEECKENGLALVDSELGGFCVPECAHGMFNGVCLPPPEPEKECDKDSPDYRGVIVQGYGKPVIPACGDFDQCADGSPGSVGFVNGELRCIADDYGKENECAADEIFIVDQYGVICAGLEDVPEEEPVPEEPNTDTDGDGVPDEYNPDNDPNINRKQLDELNEGQDQANKSLSNLEKIGKGTNDRLDDISGGVDDLVGLTGQINDKLQAPDGGFDISGFLNAPTMSESAQGMADYVSQTGYGQLLATLSSFPTSANCPVYTIPATDYWGALTMDVHCQVLEDYRGLFSALFMFFWSVTALFVFFRA